MAEYMSFEEVTGTLELDEDSLKRMVADGEIRAFRNEGRTVFKREDVDHLREALSAEPVIVPAGNEESEALSEDDLETVLNIEGLGEIDLSEEIETAAATSVEDEEEDTFVVVEDGGMGGPSDTVSIEEATGDTVTLGDETSVEEETFVLSEADIGDETESLELLGETSTVLDEAGRPAPGAGGTAGAGFVQGAGPAYSQEGTDVVFVGLLMVTILVMIFGMFACIGLIVGQSNPLLSLLSGS